MDTNITCSPSLPLPLFPHAHIVAAISILIVAGVFHFLGQLISITSWPTAIRLGLQEANLPPDYYPYEHGIAIADVILGVTYIPTAIGLLLSRPWAFQLVWLPSSVLLYHSLFQWYCEADRRAAGHGLMTDTFRLIWCGANFAAGLLGIAVALAGPACCAAAQKMLSWPASWSFGFNFGDVLAALMTLYIVLVAMWQRRVLEGREMRNPDGSVDSWKAQKTHYGIALADLVVVLPVCVVATLSRLVVPRVGYFGFALLAFWFVWANVMTTATSLRFEKPKITVEWCVVYPAGIVLGVAYLLWIAFWFEQVVLT